MEMPPAPFLFSASTPKSNVPKSPASTPSEPSATPPAPNPPSPNSSAAPPTQKIFSPPSSPPSKPTPPSAKSPTPSAASSANTRNLWSSDLECGSLLPLFRPPLRLDQSTGCHCSCAIVFFPSENSYEVDPRFRFRPPRRNPSRRWLLVFRADLRRRRNALPRRIRSRPRAAPGLRQSRTRYRPRRWPCHRHLCRHRSHPGRPHLRQAPLLRRRPPHARKTFRPHPLRLHRRRSHPPSRRREPHLRRNDSRPFRQAR